MTLKNKDTGKTDDKPQEELPHFCLQHAPRQIEATP